MSDRVVHLAHSPDSDDAFMFYALAAGKVDTEGLRYVHELQDIETLNQRARRAELEVTAVSIHAYAYLTDVYALLPHGASMGDRYGPRLVARSPLRRADVRGRTVANPRMPDHRVPGVVAVRARFRCCSDPVRPDRGRGGERGCRAGPTDSRRAAHVRRARPPPGCRHGRVVAWRDRAPASARRECHPEGPRRHPHVPGVAAFCGRALRTGSRTGDRHSITPCSMPGASSAAKPTRSWGCT